METPKRELRRGWTTGACATAAVKAALLRLWGDGFPEAVTITLPRGERPSFALARHDAGPGWAEAGIVKDAGDDPDVTHGALIIARVREAGAGVRFLAGEGVGMVTKPGLPIPPGEPAINPVPREMMLRAAWEAGLASGRFAVPLPAEGGALPDRGSAEGDEQGGADGSEPRGADGSEPRGADGSEPRGADGENRSSGNPENRKTGNPEIRKTGKLENRKTGFPENRNSGNPGPPLPAAPDDGPAGAGASPAPGLAAQWQAAGLPGLEITISIPGGEKLAAKTWNPRLGIVGGLSVLGTTGIVRPFSCAAWIASIHRGVDVARASGLTHVAGCTGATSEGAVQALYGLPDHAMLDMGDFAGGMLKYLARHPVAQVTIGGGIAKLAKLAQGALDLHSARSQVDFARLAALVGDARVAEAHTVLEAFETIGLPLAERVAQAALDNVRARFGTAIAFDVVVVSREGAVIARAGP